MERAAERERILLEAIDTGSLASDDPELTATVATYQQLETLLDQWRLPRELADDVEADAAILELAGYEIQEQLGHGGFGRVFLAKDWRLGRQVAIKLPKWDQRLTRDHVERALSEARLSAELRHPGIVSIHDVRPVAGQLAIVYEYVEGESLETLLAQGTLTSNELLERLREVAQALAHVHQKGIVHGDLKPANILVDNQQGHARITDFGLGFHDAYRLSSSMTQRGTLPYMAPELLNGSNYLDGRVDVWAFGVILYRALTGQLPFSGRDRTELIDAIRERAPKPPRQLNSQISPQLEQVCLKCLEKNPAHRYTSAVALSEALHQPTHSRRTIAWTAVVLAIAAAVLWAVRPLPRATPISRATPVRADNISVHHFAFSADGSAPAKSLGPVGVASAAARLDDDVAVEVSLAAPMYFYLIALNPDGTTELCWPQDDDTVPRATAQAICPSAEEVYGLTEGAGAQVFVLFADAAPLPSYADWKSRHGAIPWTATRGYNGQVWFFDEQQGCRPSLLNHSRVTARSRGAPEPFVRACQFFATRSPSNSVAAVLFPVVDR